MSEYFSGRVTAVVFGNQAQSFYIVRMNLDTNQSNITVRGNVPGLTLRPGVWFGFEANWETHDKYGKQLVIQRAPIIKNVMDTQTAIKMLENHGIGVRVCQLLHAHFGDNLVDVLGNEEELQKVPTISPFSALHIVSRWTTIRSLFKSLDFLGDLKIPKSKVNQVYAHFGDKAEEILSENPWELVQIEGITFEQADEVAQKMGLVLNSEKRLRGSILYVCKSRRSLGHLYLNSGELVDGVLEIVPGYTKQQIAKVLKQLHDEKLLVLDNKTVEGRIAIYEPWFYELENKCADFLALRQNSAQFDEASLKDYVQRLGSIGPKSALLAQQPEIDLLTLAKEVVIEWSEHGKLHLSEAQLQGAINALTQPISILTGLPGTGKTTALKLVVKVLQDIREPFLLVAPTGIAAKRLSIVTGAEAYTIHRAFAAKNIGGEEDDRESTYAGIVGLGGGASSDEDGSKEFWGYSEANPFSVKVMIVDESSMVDQHLLFRLLSCTSKDCRIVFVGDAAQLPSVGPGNVLKDMISSDLFPVVDLREIFRQTETSDIILAAHSINRGEVPSFESRSKDFRFLEIVNEEDILEKLIELVKYLYERRINFQVLSPRHSGTLGVTNLNLRIREILNPKTPGAREMRLGQEVIREGDRVMVSKNNYRYEIFNGDVGKIDQLDDKEKVVILKIHGPPVTFIRIPFKEAPQYLRMAYCVTVHKSQGQEYEVIIMPWVNSFRHQLQRNLLYTGITRAKKKVVLIGHKEALERAVTNSKVDIRNTFFPNRIQNAIIKTLKKE